MTHILTKSLIQKDEYVGLIENQEDNDIEDVMERTPYSKRKEIINNK